MWQDALAALDFRTLSAADWGLLAISAIAAVLTIWSLVRSAPIRNNLEAAMNAAFDGLASDDDAPSINSEGDLRKITLAATTKAANWRKAAERYVAFIDRTNKRLVRSIAADFAIFSVGAWLLSTIASLSFLLLLDRRVNPLQPIDYRQFVIDMNANSLAQYFNQPVVDIDPNASTTLDLIVTFPYAWILGIIGIPAFFSFGLKLFVNRRAKWAKTRAFLSNLLAKDDIALQAELDRYRDDKAPDYYKPWFAPSAELVALTFEFEHRIARRANTLGPRRAASAETPAAIPLVGG